MATIPVPDRLHAWRPEVPGVREALYAELAAHAYPMHVHEEWTLLLIDRGAVEYRLGRARHVAPTASVSLLPPGVAHDGHSARRGLSFTKRVVYLERDWIDDVSAGAIVDRPLVPNPSVTQLVLRFHESIATPGGGFAAESLLGAIRAEVLSGLSPTSRPIARDTPLAVRLRDLLDGSLIDPPTLRDAGVALGASPEHLCRAFSHAYGVPPHRYVIGRRVNAARRLLLDGVSPADVAARTGFADQSHLTRTFRRTLGTTPARFSAGRGREVEPDCGSIPRYAADPSRT